MIVGAGGILYVANDTNPGTVSKFLAGSTTSSATLSGGLVDPDAFAVDASGDLFVASAYEAASTVAEFTPGSTTPILTLTGASDVAALAVDSSGNLYAATFNLGLGSTVSEFAGSHDPDGHAKRGKWSQRSDVRLERQLVREQ